MKVYGKIICAIFFCAKTLIYYTTIVSFTANQCMHLQHNFQYPLRCANILSFQFLSKGHSSQYLDLLVVRARNTTMFNRKLLRIISRWIGFFRVVSCRKKGKVRFREINSSSEILFLALIIN